MNVLPAGTFLGKLALGEVYEYYDFPRIFSSRSASGQQFIAISTFDDHVESHWLYVPVSSLRLGAIGAGGISLRDAIVSPEGGHLVQIIQYHDQRPASAQYILPEQVTEDDLPDPAYLVDAIASQDTDVELSPQQVADSCRRETFDYRIFAERPAQHEIPSRKLGGILTSTQELVDALGQAALGAPTIRGPISSDVLELTRLNVSHSFRSSFGVQFRASSFSDLFNESLLASAIHELTNLLQAEDSEDRLSNKLHALKGRVASKYRRLLKELSDIDSGLALEWGSVSPGRGGNFHLTAAQVRSAYAIVDRIDIAMAEEIKIIGSLVGFNSRTKRYELTACEDGKRFLGKVSDDALIEVENPAIGQKYEVALRMLVETQSTSGDELVRWVMVRLSLPSPMGDS